MEENLSGGLKGVTIFLIVINCISLVAVLICAFTLNTINSILTTSLGAGATVLTMTDIIISIILSALELAALIMILMKKTIGVYGYFAITIINIIFSIISSGFSFAIIFSIIFPVIMFFLIKKNDNVFHIFEKEA